MKKTIFFLALLPVFVFASTGGKDYDIVARAINFIIFAGIVYYLIATPIKNAYNSRIKSISDRLEAIENKLKVSKSNKEDAIRSVEKARLDAESYIITAKKEAEILAEKIENETKMEIEYLEKSYDDQKTFEDRKMVRNLVNEMLNDLFSDDSLNIDEKEFVNLIVKKVG